MNPWTCAALIALAGALGGVANALKSDNGFFMPGREAKVWCPGFISNVLLGAFQLLPRGRFTVRGLPSTSPS